MELPDEIWNYILDFTLDWKETHKRKFKKILEKQIDNCYHEIYTRWTYFPPWPNTNDIILAEYVDNDRLPYAPPPNLHLTSITKWPNKSFKQNTTGWWCGYGWKKST
ncbi:MAG: hypothetical protein CML42_00335 [Rhodobacteraceae bacterium]|nr:hypothetical protein [Paracoccaceae bacterium]|tara:strand:+ start:17082 stop:17402 length:321 start_codon:yes stop_codon:yes gene_type:complete